MSVEKPYRRNGVLSRITQANKFQKYVGGKQVSYSVSERDSVLATLEAKIDSYLLGSQTVQTNDLDLAASMGYTYISAGEALTAPEPLVRFYNVKEGIPHEEFEKRKKAGEIMMSDYTRSSVSVKQTAGMRIGRVLVYPSSNLSCKPLVSGGILTAHGTGYKSYLEIAGTPYRFRNTTPDGVIANHNRIRTSISPWEFEPEPSYFLLMSALRSFKPETTSMITKALARINRSSVDVLTAFAEAPKSIGSVLRSFSAVANILRDAKKGQFDLTKAHGLRKKRADLRYKNRISRIDKELRNSKLSSKRRKSLLNERNRVHLGYREYLIKSADELASALADLWLTYRYMIMPNVYLAQDVFDATMKYGRKWITARESQSETHSIPVLGTHMECTVKSKVTIKRNFSSTLSNVESVISNDIFVTAWELIPLSFVYDWFINFGDFLSAQNYKVTWDQNKSCLSKKMHFDADLGLSDPAIEWLIEPNTNVHGFYYERQVINPSEHCGLVWQPTIGLVRQIDALALIWRPVRSLLLKGKNR